MLAELVGQHTQAFTLVAMNGPLADMFPRDDLVR